MTWMEFKDKYKNYEYLSNYEFYLNKGIKITNVIFIYSSIIKDVRSHTR